MRTGMWVMKLILMLTKSTMSAAHAFKLMYMFDLLLLQHSHPMFRTQPNDVATKWEPYQDMLGLPAPLPWE